MSSPATKTLGHRWRWLVPALILVAGFHLLPFGAKALDHALLDSASRHPLRQLKIPEGSALVLVDETTLASLGHDLHMRWPFPRVAFAGLIAALNRSGASRIVVDVNFFEESEDRSQDEILAAMAAAAPGTVLGAGVDRGPIFWPAEYRAAHATFFRQPRTALTDYHPDSDGVMRSYPAHGSLGAAGFDHELASPGGLLRWQGSLNEIQARGVSVLPAEFFVRAGLGIMNDLMQKVPDPSPEDYARVLAQEPELTGPLVDRVKGKVVFFGTNASGTFDFKELPVGPTEPGILLHWTAWTDLAGAGFITRISRDYELGAAILFMGLVLTAAWRWPGLTAPAILVIGVVVVLLTGCYAGLSLGWFFPPATPVVAGVVTLLGVAAESFWTERARKREIQSMFGAYVDSGVVELLVKDPDAIQLRGEKREATVFFSDLAGFTELSEKLKDQPDRMVEAVNAYLDETSECLMNHRAYVDKYIGDAVMAVFGVPQALPDHALAGCLAALEVQRMVPELNRRYAVPLGITLAVRIGLNTGELIVGNVGSTRKRNYTVMGDTVNLASRLEGANKAFGTGILVGDETARRVQGRIVTQPLARLQVKGKHEAIEVHTLLGRPEELTAVDQDFLAAYLTGYDAYGKAQFREAVVALERALVLRPGDKWTASLRDEAKSCSLHPLPPGWEPVLKLDSK